jgi:alpha-D-xyloside xylohydrolase
VAAAAAPSITVERDAAGVVMHGAGETLRLSVCGPTLIHVVASPSGARSSSPAEPWIATPCKPEHFDFTRDQKQAVVTTAGVRVLLSLEDGRLTFQDAAGNTRAIESDREPRRYEPAQVNGENLYRVSQRFFMDAQQGLYGLGQHQNGVFNYRGTVVELGQANTDIAVPLLISSNGSGILWNTASRSWFDNRFATELKLTADAADAIDYYFIYGPQIDSVIHQYRELTGHAPLFGKWAYGFFQSKDRYKSAQELLDVAGKYRAAHVPLDVMVQDWFWWKQQGDSAYTDEYL